MIARINELKAERSQLKTRARQIVMTAEGENRDTTPAENTDLQGLRDQIAALSARIDRLEAMDAAEDDPANTGAPSDGRASGGRSGPPVEGRGAAPDLPALDGRHKYSLCRAIGIIAEHRALNGLEGEVSAQLARLHGKSPQGFYVPLSLATHRDQFAAEQRTLGLTQGTGSVAAILGTDFIQLLRNRLLTRKFGAKVLTGLYGGTFSLPKQTASATSAWVAEGSAPSGSNQTIGQVTFTPKTLAVWTDISRKFIKQTSLDAEAFVREDLALVMALEMDRAALNGSGSGQEPTGILQDSGVSTTAVGTNGGVPTWAMLVAMETAVANANADYGSLGYIGSPNVRGRLKTTVKDTSTNGIYLWMEDEVNGYPAGATAQIPSTFTKGSGTGLSGLVFGNWESLVTGMWGGLDVLVDPYTGSNTGTVRINMMQDCDIVMRYKAAFNKMVDITP
jgi:HK97 family phage major capsid protein